MECDAILGRVVHSYDQEDEGALERAIDCAIAYLNDYPEFATDFAVPERYFAVQQALPAQRSPLQQRVNDLWRQVFILRQAQGFEPLTYLSEGSLFDFTTGPFFVGGDGLWIRKDALHDSNCSWEQVQELLKTYPDLQELKIVGRMSHCQSFERPLLEKLCRQNIPLEELTEKNPLQCLSSEELAEIAPLLTSLDLRGVNISNPELYALIESARQLKYLFIQGIVDGLGLQLVPNSLLKLDISSCPKLAVLNLRGHPQIQEVCIRDCPELWTFRLSGYGQLREMTIQGCGQLTSFSAETCPELISVKLRDCDRTLQYVNTSGCPKLVDLNLEQFRGLGRLDVSGCASLQSVGPSFDSLGYLNYEDCLDFQPPGIPPTTWHVYAPHPHGNYTVDLEALENKPLSLLLTAGRKFLLEDKPFPNIRFNRSEGIDAGGLRRHFFSTLFKYFAKDDQFFTGEEGQRLPKIFQSTDTTDNEDAWKTVGKIFRLCHRSRSGSLLTGAHFDESLFYAIRWILLNVHDYEDISPDNKAKIYAVLRGWRESKGAIEDWVGAVDVDESLVMPAIWIAQAMAEDALTEGLRSEERVDAFRKRIAGEKATWDRLRERLHWSGDCGRMPSFLERWAGENPAKLEEFVLFATGNRSLDQQRITISVFPSRDPQALPNSHTCVFTVEMPVYRDYATFKQKLEAALLSNRGFQVV